MSTVSTVTDGRFACEWRFPNCS